MEKEAITYDIYRAERNLLNSETDDQLPGNSKKLHLWVDLQDKKYHKIGTYRKAFIDKNKTIDKYEALYYMYKPASDSGPWVDIRTPKQVKKHKKETFVDYIKTLYRDLIKTRYYFLKLREEGDFDLFIQELNREARPQETFLENLNNLPNVKTYLME